MKPSQTHVSVCVSCLVLIVLWFLQGHFVPSNGVWRKFLADFMRNPFMPTPSPGMASASAPPSGTATPTTSVSPGGPTMPLMAQKL